jgi:RimJ/RimL family protein N-acetyltransferase
MKIASPIAIRAARPADRELVQKLVRELSPRSRYLRFFNGIHELSPSWLERFVRADPRGDFTLVALVGETAVGMAQYAAAPYPQRCEFAVLIADAWQRVGIGTALLRDLVSVAREAGFERIDGEVLAENMAILRLLERAGFRARRDPRGALSYCVSLPLSDGEVRQVVAAAARH